MASTSSSDTARDPDGARDVQELLTTALAKGQSVSLESGEGASTTVSPELAEALLALVSRIARGEEVTVLASEALLTTQQAADLLNVSRPFVSKLLQEGVIPFVQVGAHRRIRVADLAAYKAKRDGERSAMLDDLARMGQDVEAS